MNDLTLFGGDTRLGSSSSDRREGDRYYTPDAQAEQLVELLTPYLRNGLDECFLEPSVGGGAFVRAIRKVVGPTSVCGIDIDPDARGLSECDRSLVDDFLEAPRMGPITWTVGNPPYARLDPSLDPRTGKQRVNKDGEPAWTQVPLAEPHARRALEVSTRGVALFLRLAFLESIEREGFWRDHQPTEVIALSRRVSFTGNGKADQHPMAWFIWQKGHAGPSSSNLLTPSGCLWPRPTPIGASGTPRVELFPRSP